MSRQLVENDKLYAVMTKDKTCILRGSKATRFVLCKIEENHGNYKMFTCKHGTIVLNNLKNKQGQIYLTNNVKELYHTESEYYTNELSELMLVPVRTQYTIDL